MSKLASRFAHAMLSYAQALVRTYVPEYIPNAYRIMIEAYSCGCFTPLNGCGLMWKEKCAPEEIACTGNFSTERSLIRTFKR